MVRLGQKRLDNTYCIEIEPGTGHLQTTIIGAGAPTRARG